MTGWLSRNKAYIAVVIPYVALAASSVAMIGVLEANRDQAELKARLANERSLLALDLQAASCLDRQQARVDNDEILLIIAASLPPAVGANIETLVRSRPPVEC